MHLQIVVKFVQFLYRAIRGKSTTLACTGIHFVAFGGNVTGLHALLMHSRPHSTLALPLPGVASNIIYNLWMHVRLGQVLADKW